MVFAVCDGPTGLSIQPDRGRNPGYGVQADGAEINKLKDLPKRN
jgi:hypothetical protein